jgi:hypothetical protein
VANAARSDDGGFVTLASATDKNFKEYLTTKDRTNTDGASAISNGRIKSAKLKSPS